MSEDDHILIERRFSGPPGSGNGGYVCGRLAQYVDGTATAVRLRVPPPLDRQMEVRRSESGATLLDGHVVVAEARPVKLSLEPPAPPSYEAAAQRYRGFALHPFPSCFVCGPQRDSADGLCIFPGPIEGRDWVACPWIPDASLASATGLVSPEFLWAALDRPGAFSFPQPEESVVLLGELQVELLGDVPVGERCVLLAWELAHEGRKHHTATALFGESGACRGIGMGTWFEVARDASKGAR